MEALGEFVIIRGDRGGPISLATWDETGEYMSPDNVGQECANYQHDESWVKGAN